MPEFIQVACQSERGRRSNNEDMYALPALPAGPAGGERGLLIMPAQRAHFAQKGYLFMVGDGLGGYEGGELASRSALEEIARRYYADPSPDLKRSLQRVIEAANRRLCSLREQPEMPSRMATTVTAVLIHQDKLVVANVGDSRAYLLRNETPQLLTGDHSPQPAIAESVFGNGKSSHLITRSLGSRSHVGVDIWEHALSPGDRLLLCSDGVSDHLDGAEMALLGSRDGVQRAANALIDRAYDNGSGDNLTVVLVEWQGKNGHG